MKIPTTSTCDFKGWALLDLDDPIPMMAYRVAVAKGITVEEFIEEVLAEKLASMPELTETELALSASRWDGSPSPALS
jgi:hypothetical protein